MNIKLKSKYFIACLIGLSVFAFVVLLDFIGAYNTLELKVFDIKVNNSTEYLEADTNIVLVTVDQKSLDFFEGNGISWPWPREFYALVLDYLKSAGAKAVLFDVDFSAGEIERLEVSAVESELRFSQAIADFQNVILVTLLTEDSSNTISNNTILEKHLYDKNIVNYLLPVYADAVSPLNSFQINCAALGVANVSPDDDGIIRNSPLVYSYKDKYLLHSSLALYSLIKNITYENLGAVFENIPFDDEGSFLINWYGAGGPENVFIYYSIHSLIVSESKRINQIDPDVPLSEFKDKIVIIGGTAFGLLDHKPVPVGGEDEYPGMEIYATILSNLLNDHYIYTGEKWIGYLIILFLSLVIPLIFFRFSRAKIMVPSIILMMIGYVLLILYLFNNMRVDIPIVGPELGMLLSFVVTAYVSYLREGRKRKEVKRLFIRYLSPHVVEELLIDPSKIELGGKEVEATIFFSDIKDFTTISENLSPRDLIVYLNEYFSHTSEIILHNKALLDKYIGDSIMAVFGVPLHRDDHAFSACKAAVEIQKVLTSFYLDLSHRNKPYFETRIGINTGRVIVGNLGTASRSDYTAIGDPVNIASRLEGINKVFGTKIIISEPTYYAAKDSVISRELDLVTVKGKNVPIRIYELIDIGSEISPLQRKKISLFEEGLLFYRERKWDEAKENFRKVISIEQADKPSEIYIERCDRFNEESPPDDWDGVFKFYTK